MIKIVFLLSLLHAAAVMRDDQPYCALRYRRLCQGKGRHVACQFPTPGKGTSCRNYTQIKFTSDLRHFIIHYINRRRQRVASGNERVRGGARLPRPEIMMLVGWDRELARLAQRLADQCHFVHDDCRATVRYPYAGQSVGEVKLRRSSDSDELSAQRAIRRVFDAWWGERRRVQPKQLTAPFRLTAKGTVWGHFSQLTVWTLRAVGCGAVRHGHEYTRMLLVCDFSHTNMLGQRTITPGSLAPCPMHTVRRSRSTYPFLCAPVRKPVLQENKDEHEGKEGYDYDYDADDEEDDDEGDTTTTVKQTRVTMRAKPKERTMSMKFSKFVSQNWRAEVEKASTYFGYLAIGNDRKTTRRAMDKFEHEIDNASYEQVTLRRYHQWKTRGPGFEGPRNGSDDRQYENLSQKKLVTFEDENSNVEEDEKNLTAHDVITNHGQNLRHRWKQTRVRPQRPGANALLNKPSGKLLRRSSLTSFMLDQDDLDQLFRDTGFNINWRKQPSS